MLGPRKRVRMRCVALPNEILCLGYYYNDSREWGFNMPVALPEPDGEREGIPLWLCPNCQRFKPLEDYGWKKRNDICPGQQVWFKQGWCNPCLQALVKRAKRVDRAGGCAVIGPRHAAFRQPLTSSIRSTARAQECQPATRFTPALALE